MFTILTILTALISVMFILSVGSTIAALRRESEETNAYNAKRITF